MSWLNELEYKYRYKCKACDAITRIRSKEGTDEMRAKAVDTPCSECGYGTEYQGFDPEPLKQTHEVAFEQNGRKGIAIRGKDGKMKYISKTKRDYMKTGNSESQYTRAYKEKLEKENQEQMLRASREQGQGKAEKVQMQKHMEEMVKGMPDGEYTSDGTSAKPINK
jgi:hypothetical protein